jgi:intracellular septation protein
MKILFDLIPVFVFFLAYFGAGHWPEDAARITGSIVGGLGLGQDLPASQVPILLATALAIVATVGQVVWLMARGRKVDRMLWISLAIIVVMGGLTLAFRDATFIKWKPTLLYWAFGIVLLVSERLLGRNLIRSMTQGQFTLPEPVWRRLNYSWVGFFAFMGALNLFVAFNFAEPTWVKFKLFGGMGLMFVFALAQGMFLARHVQDQEAEK